jgi:hypothetical protein
MEYKMFFTAKFMNQKTPINLTVLVFYKYTKTTTIWIQIFILIQPPLSYSPIPPLWVQKGGTSTQPNSFHF